MQQVKLSKIIVAKSTEETSSAVPKAWGETAAVKKANKEAADAYTARGHPKVTQSVTHVRDSSAKEVVLKVLLGRTLFMTLKVSQPFHMSALRSHPP